MEMARRRERERGERKKRQRREKRRDEKRGASNSLGMGRVSLKLKEEVKKPNGKAPMPKLMWKPPSPKPGKLAELNDELESGGSDL